MFSTLILTVFIIFIFLYLVFEGLVRLGIKEERKSYSKKRTTGYLFKKHKFITKKINIRKKI